MLAKPPAHFLILFSLLLMAVPAAAQERTAGVLVNTEDAYDGYALFSPIFDRDIYLIDNDGRVIHRWLIEGTSGITEAHLLDNGHLIIVAAARNEADKTLMPRPGFLG